MPIASDPLKREFYVYQFQVEGYPFYVGIGRDRRGDDRQRYVGTLLRPHNAPKLARSSLSVRVMAELLRSDKKVDYVLCTPRTLTRSEALEFERQEIARLLAEGYALTNWQHNAFRHQHVKKAVQAILSKQLRRGDYPAILNHLTDSSSPS